MASTTAISAISSARIVDHGGSFRVSEPPGDGLLAAFEEVLEAFAVGVEPVLGDSDIAP
jgi:hypothetical protein